MNLPLKDILLILPILFFWNMRVTTYIIHATLSRLRNLRPTVKVFCWQTNNYDRINKFYFGTVSVKTRVLAATYNVKPFRY